MPLVTVICLCYNQFRFVKDAVESVIGQTYKNIELIVVNDASKDESSEIIKEICQKYPLIQFIDNQQNLGMCKSFNNALHKANGDFIIDLAADDILMPERIEKQVKAFEKLDDTWGVVFTDAYTVDEHGNNTGTFYRRGGNMELLENVISGNVFTKVVAKYQICSPTIMVRKKTLIELGGFDASLNYEDYDFYIRSSRNYKYFFLGEILTIKRDVKGSDSYKWYKKKNNPHLESTLKILKKYLWLCKDKQEKYASLPSIRYHMRQSLFMECFHLAKEYYQLINDMHKVTPLDSIIYTLATLNIPLHSLFNLYRKVTQVLIIKTSEQS